MHYLYDRLRTLWRWMQSRNLARGRTVAVAAGIAALATALTVVLSCYPIWEHREEPRPAAPTVRARLAEGEAALTVGAASTASWRQGDTGEVFLTGSGPWQVQARAGGVQVGDRSIFGSAVVLSSDSGFKIDDRRYRGKLIVHPTGSGLTAVNSLTVEEYLRGVVPSELPASWPADALAAQAIAARTFVLHKMSRTGGDRWHLKALELAYQGMEREHPRATRAVQQTSGIVLTDGG